MSRPRAVKVLELLALLLWIVNPGNGHPFRNCPRIQFMSASLVGRDPSMNQTRQLQRISEVTWLLGLYASGLKLYHVGNGEPSVCGTETLDIRILSSAQSPTNVRMAQQIQCRGLAQIRHEGLHEGV